MDTRKEDISNPSESEQFTGLSKPIWDISDETGKYPAYVGKEADPISLMRKRQRRYRGMERSQGD